SPSRTKTTAQTPPHVRAANGASPSHPQAATAGPERHSPSSPSSTSPAHPFATHGASPTSLCPSPTAAGPRIERRLTCVGTLVGRGSGQTGRLLTSAGADVASDGPAAGL